MEKRAEIREGMSGRKRIKRHVRISVEESAQNRLLAVDGANKTISGRLEGSQKGNAGLKRKL